MDHIAKLASDEQLVKHKNLKIILPNLLHGKVYIFRNVLSRICGTLCEPQEIPGGPPVVKMSPRAFCAAQARDAFWEFSYNQHLSFLVYSPMFKSAPPASEQVFLKEHRGG